MGLGDLDLRINAVRDDLADEAFRDVVKVEKFVSPWEGQVISNIAPLKRYPRFDSPLDTEILFGETVKVFEDHEGWSWVQVIRDGYVGYVPSDCISKNIKSATHRVCALRTFVYSAPDIKVPPADFLSMNALVSVSEPTEKFMKLSNGFYIYKSHLKPLDEFEVDFVEVARRFLHVPYLWGGRSSLGIDCSGLVQMALQAIGRHVLRDSDMLEGSLGDVLPDGPDPQCLKRGDFVFWDGHVGIMSEDDILLHANGHHMETIEEPVIKAINRIAEIYGPVKCFKRLIS